MILAACRSGRVVPCLVGFRVLLFRARYIAVALSVSGGMLVACGRQVGQPSTQGVPPQVTRPLSPTPTTPSAAPDAMSQPLDTRGRLSRPSKLTVAKQVGRGALFASPADGNEWPEHCRVRRKCPPVEPLKRCIRPMAAVDAFHLGEVREGDRVVVRGPLWIGGTRSTTAAICAPNECCNVVDASVAVGALILGEEPRCFGDNSGVCCSVPAFGQNVIATGVIRPIFSRWTLVSPNLCVE